LLAVSKVFEYNNLKIFKLSSYVNNFRPSIEDILFLYTSNIGYFFVNSYIVASIIGLVSSQNIFTVWRTRFLWTAPGYLAGASVAALIYVVLEYSKKYLWVATPIILLILPIPVVVFLAYRYHSDWQRESISRIEEKEKHIRELKQSHKELESSKEELERMYSSTVEAFALAIDAKDHYTKEHIQRVKLFSVAIAEELGFTGDALKAIETGAALHDIGKIAIPEHILNKPGRLTAEEFELVKRHPDMGTRILQPVHFPYPVLGVVRSHHERWDGKGYPDGLAGEDIPLGGRILAVADVYDALTTDRAYRTGWPHAKAMRYIQEQAGTHFDRDIVAAFVRVTETMPELSNNREPNLDEETGRTEDAVTRASFEYLTVYETAQIISLPRTCQEMSSALIDKLTQIFKATAGIVVLAQEDTLAVAAAAGANTDYFVGAAVDRQAGRTWECFQNTHGIVDEYDSSDLMLVASTAPWTPLRGAVIAPIVADGRVMGTINLYHERRDAFDGEHLRVLTAAASHAARSIQESLQLEDNRRLAFTDTATGLYNERYLLRAFDRELAQARNAGGSVSVVMLEIDGVAATDAKTQRELGRHLQGSLRAGDLVTRGASGEFVIILPGTTGENTRTVIHNLRSAVRNGPSTASLTCCIGAASFPIDGFETTRLLACANKRMLQDRNYPQVAVSTAAPLRLAA
jgi:diguanylate cyclase (GGDEF)-like protein